MEADKTTLDDLNILRGEDGYSVSDKLNLTQTIPGQQQLRRLLAQPLQSLEQIQQMQQTLLWLQARLNEWPTRISNGTIMVLEKFYETPIDPLPAQVRSWDAWQYRILHHADYSLVKYSATHGFDFIKGLQDLLRLCLTDSTPEPLRSLLLGMQLRLNQPAFAVVEKFAQAADLPIPQLLQFARFLRFRYKNELVHLLQSHAQLDAWYSLARASQELQLTFPQFTAAESPLVEASGLFHPLLKEPVRYEINLSPEQNFLFLTGANMAGKSTFIKSVGIAVYLAHLGMAVPARSMRLSFFDGILSNINIHDNIFRGESYFYNEVMRIRSTIQKVNNQRRWLILIDELFKGTNVQDAMKCSSLVIEGLIKIKSSTFILSTHLYEIGAALNVHPNIRFNYFETQVTDDQLQFSYQLKEGISNDRLGYLILKKEGVVQLLENL
jgi:DNA mismatch repair ATPase MutS